jgi:hypothetical protein
MAVQQAVQPAQEGSVMFQQPGPGAETTSFRTWASVDVVVKLQVTDAQVADQEIGDFIQVLDRRRMPQVKVVPAVLHHPLARPGEEGVGWELVSYGAAHPDHFRFQPQAGHHPLGSDAVEHLAEATWEAGG